MRHALKLAETAYRRGEVPVGSVIVLNGEIVGRGHNMMIESGSVLSHAEILALKDAEENFRDLSEATIYITLEPCPMCLGAILLSRIKHIVYSASDPRTGACGSAIDLIGLGRFPTPPLVTSGLLEEESGELIKAFFKEVRSGEI